MSRNIKSNLAIHNGRKIRSKPMPSRMAFGYNELKAIKKVFDYYKKRKKDFGYQGRFENLYTKAFVRYMGGIGYADVVCSGTAALFVAVASLQLKPKSHVVVSPVTDPGTINAIILNGLVPVLADSSPGSYNIGVEEFKSRITDKTKAVIVVHSSGKSAPIDEILAVSKSKGLYVIEDCSQAHGAKLHGKKVGTFSDIACFSTMYKKIHATGGCGGVVFTRDERLYNLARAYADRGKQFHKEDFNENNPSSFLFPALNLNIDELSCAIGIEMLKKLEYIIKKRINFLQDLSEEIMTHSKVCRLQEVSKDDSPFFHPVLVDTSKISCTKLEFAQTIKAEGIDINLDYRYVVCEWAWVKPYLYDDFKCQNAIHFRENSFNLLFNENYGKKEVEDIVNAILKVEEVYAL